MTTLQFLIDVFLHLDVYLKSFMHTYGAVMYVLMFLVIFCETGLVVTPFLPGDSLIFAAGALVPGGVIGWPAVFLFMAAAIGGNMLNYQIGHALSDRVTSRQKIRFIKAEYLEKTHRFFEKYGALTVIITRFMPIIRTFAPFVAGVGAMTRKRFYLYNIIGGTLWVCFFFWGGYFFGNLTPVREHFSLVVVGIVVVSVLPAVIAFFKSHGSRAKRVKTPEA